MRRREHRLLAFVVTTGLLLSALAGRAAAEEKHPEYLKAVRAYADALLERGRDTYGRVHSPLIAATLDRKSLKLFDGEGLKKIRSIPRAAWGIRAHDRVTTGANPMHDQNLYQILYALTEITGEKRYAAEADRTLKWFFEHCQSPKTGLMAWGEHIGWDFVKDGVAGNTHEYFRPWVLWERSFQLAPGACARFARGVWEHQIGDHKRGNFSRHARWDRHGPGRNSEYPRHGGFYIATWAAAYEKTKDAVFLRAIETLVDYFDGRRSPQSGAIPAESHSRSKGLTAWPPSNLSLAVDLWAGAAKVPGPLAKKMRASAAKTDEVYLKIQHDLSPKGKGFVGSAHTHTLNPTGYGKGAWGAGYGVGGDAPVANLCLLRYRQVKRDGYRTLALAAAARYLRSDPDTRLALHPGTFGHVIQLLLAAHELTGEERFGARADRLAKMAIELFLPDGSPLPKATSKHGHYEAITLGDTLMMALLQLWAAENRPDRKPRLVFNDR